MSFDLTKMMQMAAEVQKLMADQGKELEAKVYEGDAGGGMVKVRVNGKVEILSVEIDSGLIENKDREMIQDLVAAAANNAVAQAKAGTGHDVETLMQRLGTSFKGEGG